MTRNFRGRPGHTSVVAHKEWDEFSQVLNTIDIAGGTVAMASTALSALEALTILRSRGLWTVELDATAINERVTVGAGLTIVSSKSPSVNPLPRTATWTFHHDCRQTRCFQLTESPAPITDISEDWLWRGYMQVSSGEEAAANTNSLFDRQVIDSKAMRKMKPGDTEVFVVEIDRSVDQGGSINVMFSVATLLGN